MEEQIKSTPILSLEEKHYNPSQIEQTIYQRWLDAKCFECDPESKKPPYSIVIPPPNVTGRLHMGHALNNSVQDCLCRYKRMDGFDVMWIPGTDHAGISTQSVVKKQLDSQGIDFKKLGREEVVKRIWEWKDKYGNQILNQLERLGASCDWSKTRFTMDDGLSHAVRVAFKKLYDDGLIYRGKYIVNWCPVDRTALSDDEVSTKEGGEAGFIWHVKYLLEDTKEISHITIATTRPETILGDSAIAVNPKDPRYKNIIGKMAIVPIVNRLIPIIADDYADPAFGTGCLKVTPAHDINDFQIGVRHNLQQINVMNDDATMGDQAPEEYHGLDRFACRDKIVSQLKNLNLLEKVEERMTPIGRAQRSGAIIEYRLSDQWFVKMQPLAKKALEFSDNGDLKLYPERWEKIYRNWLENSRDWCISRQIWWGHQIPAWYHKTSDKILVDIETPLEVKNNPEEWIQDQDVLDTWFSSALWPYSTMNWPNNENNKILSRYYPTSLLSTAKDIIYFWVARMVMTGTHFLNKTPFKEVYFHPVICDAKGETMSKSKGNGIDPIHVIEGATTTELEGPIRDARPVLMDEMLKELHQNYPNGFNGVGADALRITLLSLNSQSQQVQLSLKKFDDVGKRFSEKLWNASRFVLSKISDGFDLEIIKDREKLNLEDKWILSQLDQTIDAVRKGFDTYSFNEAINSLLRFFWDDICDWYLEISKNPLKIKESNEALIKRSVLAHVYIETLKLLHPIVPFVTEELWSHLINIQGQKQRQNSQNKFIGELDFPKSTNTYDKKLTEKFEILQDIVREIRNCKTQSGINANTKLKAYFKSIKTEKANLIIENNILIESVANLESITQVNEKPQKSISCVLDGLEIYLDISGAINIDAEIDRNNKALAKIEKEIMNLETRLNNKSFIERAPKNVLDENKALLESWIEKRNKTMAILKELK